MSDDPEYQRLLRLRDEALKRGDQEAAIAYGGAAIRRGDELLGKPLFGPLWESVEKLRRALR